MTDKEIHQLIEDSHSEDKTLWHDQVRARVDEAVALQQRKRRRRTFFVRRYVPLIAVVLVVVCLSVVLPLTLQSQDHYIKYTNNDIVSQLSTETIKEFAHNNNLPILYLDWYDIAEDCSTTKVVEKNNPSNLIYLTETMINGGYKVIYSVMKNNISVDSFDSYEEDQTEYICSNGVKVYCSIKLTEIQANFEYNGYKYYLNFTNCADEEFFHQTLESMFVQ